MNVFTYLKIGVSACVLQFSDSFQGEEEDEVNQ